MRPGNLECLDLFDRGRPRPIARGYSWRTYQSVGARPTSPVIYKLAPKSFKYWLNLREGQYRWSLPGRHWAIVQKNWSNNHSRECSKYTRAGGSKKKIHKRAMDSRCGYKKRGVARSWCGQWEQWLPTIFVKQCLRELDSPALLGLDIIRWGLTSNYANNSGWTICSKQTKLSVHRSC